MKKTIFDFEDYKAYLEAWIDSQPSRGHGQRGKLAQSIGCQTAFISHVMNGNSHLSLEQAEKMNSYLGHGQEEARFFLALVQLARAGTEGLRAHFRKHVQELIARHAVLKDKITTNREVLPEDRALYFSSWVYSAVHVLLTIPRFRTKADVARELKLAVEQVGEILEFLVSRGLVNQQGDQFSLGQTLIHLDKDSPLVSKHHVNWRLQAMQRLDQRRPNDFHYSSAVSLSQKDAAKLRQLVADFVADFQRVVQPSPEELVMGLCLDFFQVNEGRK